MNVLFLDDSQVRHQRFNEACSKNPKAPKVLHVYSAGEAIEALTNCPRFDAVHLDYDLSMGPAPHETGYQVALFIITMPEQMIPKKVTVHSSYPDGAKKMADCLEGYTEVCLAPFAC